MFTADMSGCPQSHVCQEEDRTKNKWGSMPHQHKGTKASGPAISPYGFEATIDTCVGLLTQRDEKKMAKKPTELKSWHVPLVDLH